MIPRAELREKTALVTGGARRIGASIVRTLAKANLNVVIHYSTSQAEANALAASVGGTGAKFLLTADLARPGAAEALFADAQDLAGPIDYLVNNASIFPFDKLDGLTAENLAENMQVNALAPLALGRALYAQDRAGAIVNLLDARINDYDREHVAYHLSKRSLAALTRMMAVDFAPRIRVNAIAPGLILPPEGKDEGYLAALAHTNPLLRHGGPEDIAAAVLFLLQSDFIAGQTIYVDGGRHLRGRFYGD